MEENKYGLLLNEQNIKLHRDYFKQMCKLIGVNVLYYAPRPDKTWTTYAELETNYFSPILVGCIFDEHPNQWTMKKLGWDSELQENASLISVPYDLENLQVGALFCVPSGIDNTKGNLFRVVKLSNQMIYPASMTCEIAPEYENTYSIESRDYEHSSFNLLNDEEEDYL